MLRPHSKKVEKSHKTQQTSYKNIGRGYAVKALAAIML